VGLKVFIGVILNDIDVIVLDLLLFFKYIFKQDKRNIDVNKH
jgi:hypothetical protein